MLNHKCIFLILICFFISGCIGPFYNPYPISKLIAKVGPPLKLNTKSVEEQINSGINEENKSENDNQENDIESNSQSTNESISDLNIEVVDEKTIIAKWELNLKENLILPPKEIKNAVSKKCLAGSKPQLITFSSSGGMAVARFKCW